MKNALAMDSQRILRNTTHPSLLITAAGYLLVLMTNGAIPFLLSPTTAQLVWLSGFAGSISNGGLVSPYIHNAGWPAPAVVSFGLSGAWPMAVLIRMGLNYVDAYTAIFALWLTLAFWGARRLALALGNGPLVASLGATLWLTLPMIWFHQAFSMLAIGFALLPTYLLPAICLRFPQRELGTYARDTLILASAALVAAFTDGYTFVFFASAALVLLPGRALFAQQRSAQDVGSKLLAWLLAFGVAYIAFRLYLGKASFPSEDLPFFRSWALDPVYLLSPPKGQLWLADLIGLSSLREQSQLFGDASVWSTTFLLPLLLLATATLALARRRPQLVWLALLIGCASLYLALGPSLKWNTLRDMASANLVHMPPEAGILNMKSGWLFEHIPGLKNMRATYRWSGLLALSAWLTVLTALPYAGKRSRTWLIGAMVLALGFNLPALVGHFNYHRYMRSMILQLDSELVVPLAQQVHPGERLAILPWGNDFAANYLAARTNIRTFNVGGDKNVAEARAYWPAALRGSEINRIDDLLDDRTLSLLLRDEADVVMLAYFEPLSAAHNWPPLDTRREAMQAVVSQLRDTGLVTLQEFPHYVLVRRAASLDKADVKHALGFTTVDCMPPECLRMTAGDPRIGNQVGGLERNMLRSDGRAGFLMFGPYQSMSPGKYELRVYGDTENLSGGRIDVVDSTHVLLAPTPLNRPAAGILFSGDVDFREPVERLEVRIFTDAGDRVAVRRYELYKPSCQAPHCLQIQGFHTGYPSQGGRITGGWVHSDHQQGYLTFGPYAPLAAGDYELDILGNARAIAGARVEVVSGHGSVVHASVPLAPQAIGPFLFKHRVQIAHDVEDAEITIWVSPADDLSIRGIQLHPLEASAQRP